MTNEELCERYQDGDREALEAIYNQNRGLIETIVRKYGALEDPDDLRQESFFAIRQAAALWDHSKGGNFATYCTYWIKQTVLRYIYNNSRTIRAPIHILERIRLYDRTVNAYRVEFGRDPTNEELFFALDLTPQQLEDLKRDIITLRTRSTAGPIGEDGEETLEDFLKDDRDPIGDAIDRIHNDELHEAIEKELRAIPEREADVIRKRYYNGLTLKETAATIGVSPERVRQLESGALRKLRRPKAEKRLQAYFTDSGAYSAGLRCGLHFFKDTHTSAQERAIMKLEEIAGRIWGDYPRPAHNGIYVAK